MADPLRQGMGQAGQPGQEPTYQELADRLTAAEKAIRDGDIGLDRLPMTALMRKLEQVWQPDLYTLAGVGSATENVIGDRAVTPAKLGVVPAVRTAKTSVTSVPHNALTFPQFNLDRYDVGAGPNEAIQGHMHYEPDPAYQLYLFAPRAGIYHVWTTAAWPASGGYDRRYTALYCTRLDGTQELNAVHEHNDASTRATHITVSTDVYLDKLEAMYVAHYQTNPGGVAVSLGASGTNAAGQTTKYIQEFGMHYVGRAS